MSQDDTDKRKMRLLSLVFLVGVVLIWIGLAPHSDNAQLGGVAVCVAGFAWVGFGGWRVVQRRLRRMQGE